MFDIPIVLFLFKRSDTLAQIINRICQVRPKKVYLIADGPRSSGELLETEEARRIAKSLIDWDCEIIENFAQSNKGVYNRIGKGAQWVFEREDRAIFIEDDNLPALSFFDYCRDLLNAYKADTRILWICGTNYLGRYAPPDGASYVYTRHLLPCGWASWSDKFLKFYDGELELFAETSIKALRSNYLDQRLFVQDMDVVAKTKRLLEVNPSLASWDRQMLYSLRAHGLYGIAPTKNQIENIGADKHSTHGGTSMKKTMTRRFCEVPTYTIEFPLRRPASVLIDPEFERRTGEIILYPVLTRWAMRLSRWLKPVLGLRQDESLILKWKQFRSRP